MRNRRRDSFGWNWSTNRARCARLSRNGPGRSFQCLISRLDRMLLGIVETRCSFCWLTSIYFRGRNASSCLPSLEASWGDTFVCTSGKTLVLGARRDACIVRERWESSFVEVTTSAGGKLVN